MSRYNLPRKTYVREGYTLLASDESLGIEVFGDELSAIAFHGKANKPDWHYRFGSIEKRDAKIADFLKAHREHAARKSAARKEKSEWQHGLKVGDIFRCSWGYDQTNIDYYEVVALHGKAVDILEICCQSEETAWLQGNSAPAPGHYVMDTYRNEAGERVEVERKPRRMIPQKGYQGEPYLAIHSFASANLMKPVAEVAGVRCFEPSHWTAYA